MSRKRKRRPLGWAAPRHHAQAKNLTPQIEASSSLVVRGAREGYCDSAAREYVNLVGLVGHADAHLASGRRGRADEADADRINDAVRSARVAMSNHCITVKK